MNTPAFSVVRTTLTAGEADLVIAALRSAGFHPLDLNNLSHFTFAGADISYHIELPTPELDEAREFLKAFENSTPAGAQNSFKRKQ